MWCLRKTKSLTQNIFTHHLKAQPKHITNKYSVFNSDEFVYKEGNEIEGFQVIRTSKIPEFNLNAIKLIHIDTGAEYLHLARNDSNNAFSVGFKTTPFDSTGVPHILEHLCTCGSEKFPCRDPYFKMLCRSMATFMNAMTGPDYTIYPFSTQIHRDYMNLMAVYLDAVFRPLLRKSDFSQEGWRLEHRDVNDCTTPIILKGVVLNEMKGVFSDNQAIFSECIMNNILPSHTYGVISGGDPLKIPSLTYDALIKFHKEHYHPSNCKLYSYGNFPLAESLKFISDHYLSKYGKVNKKYSEDTFVPLEARWLSPKRKHIESRVDNMAHPEMQSAISISNLCGDVCNVEESFTMNVLSELLVSGPNSPFYRALVEPNISAGFSPSTGYCNNTRSTFFSVGLQGLRQSDFDWVIDTYNKTIDSVIKDGFKEKNIEGVLHNIELGIKHQSPDFGLGVLFSITSPWIHDADIFEFLNINKSIYNFRKKLFNNPKCLQKSVEKYFKDNPHRLVLSMSPSDDFDKKLIKLEEDLLKSKLESMADDEIRSVYDEGIQLKILQERSEDISCLPSLKISDLNKDIENVDLNKMEFSGIQVQLSVQPTNGLAYFYGLVNMDDVSEEKKNFLPVFCYMADKMGTPNIDYRKLDQQVLLVTKGLGLNYFNSESLTNVSEFQEGVGLTSFCLIRNSEKMFSLWSELFTNVDGSVFENKERFHTLISGLAASYLNGVLHSGHVYAMLSSSSLINESARRKENCHGLTMVRALQKVSLPGEIDNTREIIKDTASLVFDKSRLKIALNTTPEAEDIVLKHLSSFCSDANTIASTDVQSSVNFRFTNSDSVLTKGIHYVLPGQVNFTGKSFLTVPYTHMDFASLRVLCRLVTMKYCIPLIREKGGAYGAGVIISVGGVISFYSYRDPNSVDTLKRFDETFDWILKNEFTKQDVEEAKLGTFQTVDAPVPPGEKGIQTFLHGLDSSKLRAHRYALMAVTGDDLLAVASKYFSLSLGIPIGKSLLGPLNSSITNYREEKWTVIE